MPNGLYAAAKSSLVASSIVVGGLLGLRAMRYVNGGSVKTRKLPPVPTNHESIESEGDSEAIALLTLNIDELTGENERLKEALGVASIKIKTLQEKIRVEGAEYTAINTELQEQISTLEAVVQGLKTKLSGRKPQ